jgi:hypothetical protein
MSIGLILLIIVVLHSWRLAHLGPQPKLGIRTERRPRAGIGHPSGAAGSREDLKAHGGRAGAAGGQGGT